MTSARVIADSISPRGHRLTTMEVVLHRFVLAEFNTHRVMSRNSASSRAIPVRKMIDRVRTNPALPVSWPAEQRGMQGGAELDHDHQLKAQQAWLAAADHAVQHAEALVAAGVHKSVANRLLEPFLWHTLIVSATDWDGFYQQRCTPLAQPEIRMAAEAMRAAHEASTPTRVDDGDWHLPYIFDEDRAEASAPVELRQISAARCARVSYLTHDGRRDRLEDLALFQRLATADPPHWSPMEHQATPASGPTAGNFDGWAQFRHAP